MLRNASRTRFPHGLLRFDLNFPRNWDLISERTFQLSFLLLFSSGSRWEASVQLSSSAEGMVKFGLIHVIMGIMISWSYGQRTGEGGTSRGY